MDGDAMVDADVDEIVNSVESSRFVGDGFDKSSGLPFTASAFRNTGARKKSTAYNKHQNGKQEKDAVGAISDVKGVVKTTTTTTTTTTTVAITTTTTVTTTSLSADAPVHDKKTQKSGGGKKQDVRETDHHYVRVCARDGCTQRAQKQEAIAMDSQSFCLEHSRFRFCCNWNCFAEARSGSVQCVNCILDAGPMPDPYQLHPSRQYDLVVVLPFDDETSASAVKSALKRRNAEVRRDSDIDPIMCQEREGRERKSLRSQLFEFNKRRTLFYRQIKLQRQRELQEKRDQAAGWKM